MADPIFDPSLPSTDFAASPAFDPNLPSEDVAEVPTFNPTEVSENQYSLADIKATTPQALAEDKDFAPIRFSVANEKALQQDPDAQNKVIEAYRIKEARGSTLLEKGKKAATGFIPALTRLVKGAAGAISTPQDIFLRQAKAITEGKGIEEAKKSVAEIAAIPASLESNVASYLDLGKGFVRAGAETVTGATRAVVGPGTITEAISSLGKSQLTPEEFRARYFSDLGSAKVATESAQGQGPALQALGLDAENLAPLGIVVDPVKIEEFSILTDPLNFVPIGAAVGIVGKTGRAIGKNIIARTATEAQAASLAKFMNEAKRVASATSATAQGGVGAGIEAVGDFITRAGAATQRNFRRAGAGVIGAGVGAILGRDIYSALGGLAITKGVPFATKVAGKSMSKVGRMVSGVDAVPAPAAFAGEAFKQGAIGTAEGAVLTAPFVIGSRTEDEEALLGMIPIAGVARAATLAPAGTRAIGEAAQNKLASEIFRTVEQASAPATAAYGTEPTLDATHAETSSKLDPQERNFVDLFRSKFEGSPIEIYAVDRKTMEHRTGNESAAGFAIEAGTKTNPDGTTSPIFRILLNESSSALPHEGYHAFEFLEPTRAREFEKSVVDNLTPQQLRNFGDTYDAALNVGKPEAQWTRLTDQGIAREVAAEAFSRIILGQDLSGVPPSVRKQASLFASGLLEKLGTPLARTGAAPAVGGSIIGGVRAGTSSVKLGQDWIKGLFDRLEQQGELLPTKTPVEPFTGTMEQLPVDLSARVPEAPAAPPVRPTQLQLPLAERVPPVAPTAPILPIIAPTAPAIAPAAPNIRVAASQLDAFARRAEDTKIPEAVASAAKLEPDIQARVAEINGHLEAGSPVLEIEHRGVTSEGAEGRTGRRAEQEAAYIAEELGAAPEEVRTTYQKTFVPVRWEIVKDKPQLLAMSLDKAIANISRTVKDAATYKVEGLIPYESAAGKLTDAGWREVTADLQAYSKNQANGFQGGGDPLVRPATDVGLSIPAETPGYVPTKLAPERADFQNLIQGLATPLTAREIKGQIPGNVKGQVLAEANLRGLEIPAAIRPENITKQEFKSISRRLMEVNPLRNKLAEAGVPVRELIEVTERINSPDIISVKPRPDLQFNAPVTDTIRGGFRPEPQESTADYGQRILQMDDATFASTMNASKGGLTGLAYDTGLALKDKNDLTILKGLAETANAAAQTAMANKDFAGAMPLIMRGQFFREALEAATNTGSAATMLPRLRPGARPPFPRTEVEPGDFAPQPNSDVQSVADTYLKGKRRQLRAAPKQDYAQVNTALAKRLADFYDEAPSDPTDLDVQKSYQALAQETLDQYKVMSDAGYTIEPWTAEGEPYASSDAMRADVAENKHLYFLPTEGNLLSEAENPMLLPSGVGDLPVNDVFRAVHDFFGHAKEGYMFGPRGEFNAWKAHSEMYSPNAQGALAAETLAQNSWVNFGKHIREAQEIPAAKDRPFAPQKNILIPKEMINEARAQFVARPVGTENLSPIKTAAIRTPGGEIFTGAWHGEAAMKLAEAIGKGELKESIPKSARIEAEAGEGPGTGFGEDGFITESGEFLNREEAFERAAAVKQIKLDPFDTILELESQEFDRRRAFAPKSTENLSPIKEAAIRTPGGEIFTGTWHGAAAMKLADAIEKGELKELLPKSARGDLWGALTKGKSTGFGEDGFVTEAGEFLNREEAFERAAAINQIKVMEDEKIRPGYRWLESNEFDSRRNFAPKIMRDAQGRPLTRDGLVDFEKLYKELAKEREIAQSITFNEAKYAIAPAKSRESSLTGWILPSGDFTDLKGNSVHEDYLASNADTLNKRFGTNFPKTPDVDERLAALNKGFVRMRLDRTGNGEEHVEINKRFWNPRNRRTIEARLQDNASEIGSVRVNLLNDAGNVVDSNVIRLANLPEDITPESAIADGLRELRGSAAPFPLAKEVTGRLKQLADNGNVTNEFWINSKTGEILFAPDGHEEAAMEFLSIEATPLDLDVPSRDVDGEMYKKGFLRAVRMTGNSDQPIIALNSGGPKVELSRRAKQTLEVLSDSYNNSPIFLDDKLVPIMGDFSPAEANLPGLKLPSEERAAQIVTRRKITKAKERFPEALVPVFQKNTEGNFIIGDDGKPKPVAIEYDLSDSPVGRSAAKGIRGDEARDDAVANALAAGIVATYKKAVKNPDIKAGEKWYSTARARLRKIFGEDSKFVTELLAATSARTPVDTNYRFALDAYNSFREGGYDALLKTYNEGKQKWETRDLANFIEDTGNQNPTRGQFIDWWVEKHDLLPRQSNGKKFGMNSRAVLRVLDGTWREEVKGPKTPNFAGNLSGDTFAATIDVWAARLLHRLANVGNDKRWRILPQNETGVTDADFNLGQAAFNKASEELEIKADALQAILWFAEKDLHEKNGWTSGAGAAKSDFNTLLSETETLPTGRKKMRSAQKELKL